MGGLCTYFPLTGTRWRALRLPEALQLQSAAVLRVSCLGRQSNPEQNHFEFNTNDGCGLWCCCALKTSRHSSLRSKLKPSASGMPNTPFYHHSSLHPTRFLFLAGWLNSEGASLADLLLLLCQTLDCMDTYERTYSQTLPAQPGSSIFQPADALDDYAIACALAGVPEAAPLPPDTSMDEELALAVHEREQRKLLRVPSSKARRRSKKLRCAPCMGVGHSTHLTCTRACADVSNRPLQHHRRSLLHHLKPTRVRQLLPTCARAADNQHPPDLCSPQLLWHLRTCACILYMHTCMRAVWCACTHCHQQQPTAVRVTHTAALRHPACPVLRSCRPRSSHE